MNWYRTRRANFEEEQDLIGKEKITQPVLFIQATHDSVLKPGMSKGMDGFIPNLTRAEVNAAHFALTQKPVEVNNIIQNWLVAQGLVEKTRQSSL